MSYRGNDHYRSGGGRDHNDLRRRSDDDRRYPVIPGYSKEEFIKEHNNKRVHEAAGENQKGGEIGPSEERTREILLCKDES